MKVELKTPKGHGIAFLKLYDRRVGKHRKHQFSRAAEVAMYKFIRAGKLASSGKEITVPEEWEVTGEYEAYYNLMSQNAFLSEIRAYGIMKKYQGCYVPRFREVVSLSLGKAPEGIPNEYMEVPGILLQYIIGCPLRELPNLLPNNPMLWQDIIQTTVNGVKAAVQNGLVMEFLSPNRFLISKIGEDTYTVYITNWEQANFRVDHANTAA